MSSSSLLRAAADALDDGQIPLENPFLSEHDVTLDQAYSLAGQLAIGARMVAEAIENPRGLQGRAMLESVARKVMDDG
jgi:hypothetical protein